MNCAKYEEKIQQFHDCELSKAEEPLIFTHLSECLQCREFFKSLNTTARFIQMELKDFPPAMDEKVFKKIRESKLPKSTGFLFKRYPAALMYSLGVVLILLTLLFFKSERDYKQEMRLALRQIEYQNEKIDLLMNTMPEIYVNSKPGSQTILQANIKGM